MIPLKLIYRTNLNSKGRSETCAETLASESDLNQVLFAGDAANFYFCQIMIGVSLPPYSGQLFLLEAPA